LSTAYIYIYRANKKSYDKSKIILTIMVIQQRTNGQFVGKWQHRQSCHRCFKVWVDESAKRFWWFLKSSNTTTNNNSGAKLFRGDEEQMKI
jgi:sarcosine oxidase delta subunit